MSASPSTPLIAWSLAYDQLCTFEVWLHGRGVRTRAPRAGVDWYQFSVCAAEPGKIRAAGGITVEAPYTLRLFDHADTIIIPGWRGADVEVPDALIKNSQCLSARCTLLYDCSGVFVLAAAGILDGGGYHALALRRKLARYPQIQVEADACISTKAKSLLQRAPAAGLDMLLYLVRKDYGESRQIKSPNVW